MITRVVAVGAVALILGRGAEASVMFDTIDAPAGPSIGYDGPKSDSTSIMAESFTSATRNFSQIALNLAANTPNDGGSSIVYLVPDNGAGGAIGMAGSPSYGNGHYNNAVLLGTINDNSLATAGSTASRVTLNVAYATDAAVAAQTHNNEYWIALVPSNTSSADWLYNADGAGVGTTSQAFFNNNSSTLADDGGALGTLSDTDGAYQMLVDTPEPGTLALIGSGLVGISWFRRRTFKQI